MTGGGRYSMGSTNHPEFLPTTLKTNDDLGPAPDLPHNTSVESDLDRTVGSGYESDTN